MTFSFYLQVLIKTAIWGQLLGVDLDTEEDEVLKQFAEVSAFLPDPRGAGHAKAFQILSVDNRRILV